MDPATTFDHFLTRTNEMTDSIRRIVDVESPSNNAEQSVKIVELVLEMFGQSGVPFEFERIPVEGVGEHLTITAFPGQGKPVLLLGHTDTVHPVGSSKQNPTRVEDGRLYGCGVFDMKANIPLMIDALRYFVITGESPVCPVRILLSCDEEVGSHSGRFVVEKEASLARKCFVIEPSAGGKVKTGRKGTGQYLLKTHGKPAHAGLEPEKGANAVTELALQIPKVHSIARPDIGTTVNVTTIKGGTTSNVIPEYAECEIDVRFKTMAEAERVNAEMNSLTSLDPQVKVEIIGGVNRPPLERTPAVEALYQKAKQLSAAFGYELGETEVGGASDGNFVGALGIPVLDGVGVAGDGAHMLTEYVLIDDLAPRAALLTLLLAEPD